MSLYAVLIAAYVIGGIPFGYFIGRLSGHGDIRTKGSGNIGSTNILRIAGPAPAAIVFLCDVGKGALAVYLCRMAYHTASVPFSIESASLTAGMLAVLGHAFSPFMKFKGGKGVNTALGMFIYILPLQSLAALGVFVVVMFITRYVSLSSMVATSFFAAVLYIEKFFMHRPIGRAYLIAATAVALLIIITHRDNIKRLIAGEEYRFDIRKAVD
ncbi:MAG: glycerol-3-phosphate 1-O-acyltransferase PlsY [Candidatus Zixiibacteriota bacterium]